MAQTATYIYDDPTLARQAVTALEEAGFSPDEISVVRQDDGGDLVSENDSVADGATTGASLGLAAGAGAGLLASLGLIAIPGIGPLVAAGVLGDLFGVFGLPLKHLWPMALLVVLAVFLLMQALPWWVTRRRPNSGDDESGES